MMTSEMLQYFHVRNLFCFNRLYSPFLGGGSGRSLEIYHTPSLHFFFHTFVLHPTCVNVPRYYNIRLRNTLLVIYFYFPDVIATCFCLLSGHHQAILTQIYQDISFYYRSWGPRFDSRALQENKKVVGLERGPLSLVSTTEELLGRKCSGFGLESREYVHRDSSLWPRGTYPQKFGTNFADERWFFGRYSSLADWGHGVS
jgi:hypothetical protein